MTQLFLKTTTTGYYMTQSVNQLLYSNTFSNAAWVKSNCSVTSGQTDPDGGSTAFYMTASAGNATLLQSVVLLGSANRVFSIYLKRKTGTGNISISVDGTTYSVEATTGSWARYDTYLSKSGTVTAGVKITTSGDEVYIAFSQLEDGTVNSTYSATSASRYTLTQITDADYPANTARGAAFLDGRFFAMAPNGDIYQSATEDASSWAATEFIGSSIEPDVGVYLAKYQNYIVAFKGWSTEFFYDAANATGSILSPVPSMAFKIGCAVDASVREMAGTIVWMGKSRDGEGREIWRMNGTAPEKISTEQVDKILLADDLAAVKSWSCKIGSHTLYGLTLGTLAVTLVYDFSSGLWSFFTYLATSGGTQTVTAITAAGVVTIAAHGRSDGQIIKLSSTNADFNGFHVVTDVTTDTFQIQATGTAFSGSGVSQLYTETVFPIIASTSCGGSQWMQDATSGALYTMTQTAYADAIGSIAARIHTPKFDGKQSGKGVAPTTQLKKMATVEIVGDKLDSTALIRWSDDDYVTYTKTRPIDLNLERSWVNRCGQFSRRSFEILHVQNTAFRVEALEIEIS